jgi:DNA-binding transcriptional LysR family regulator
MIDIRTLQTFAAVTRLGSFRRAAEQLHTTQPAISQRIAQLETELGAQLLTRNRRSVIPTPKGRQLLEFADRLIRLREEMIKAVAGSDAVSGVLRIGASETVVHTWLSRLLRRARQDFPNLSLEIEVDISPRLLDRLVSREIDLAFMVGPIATPEVSAQPLGSYPVAFVASPAIEWTTAPVTIEELMRWPMLTFSRRTKPFDAVEELFRSVDRSAVRLHASASLATAVHMALDGSCIAVIPPAIVTDHLERGDLKIVDAVPSLPPVEIVASWCGDNRSPAVSAIVEMAVALAPEPEPAPKRRNRRPPHAR